MTRWKPLSSLPSEDDAAKIPVSRAAPVHGALSLGPQAGRRAAIDDQDRSGHESRVVANQE